MQNHNPFKKQTLDKMLDGETICPVYLEDSQENICCASDDLYFGNENLWKHVRTK